MKNLKKISLVMICSIAFSPIAASYSASPSLNSRCGYSLSTPSNGSGVIFDESCTIAYVYPPKHGTAEIAGLAQTTNLQFCSSLKDINQISERTFKSMKILNEKVEKMIFDFEPLEQTLVSLKLELVSAQTKTESAKKRLDEAENQLQVMRENIRESRKVHENCVEEQSATYSSCIELKSAWDEAKNDLSKFRNNEYRNIRAAADDAAEQYDLLSARFSAQRNRYT